MVKAERSDVKAYLLTNTHARTHTHTHTNRLGCILRKTPLIRVRDDQSEGRKRITASVETVTSHWRLSHTISDHSVSVSSTHTHRDTHTTHSVLQVTEKKAKGSVVWRWTTHRHEPRLQKE